MSIDVPKPMTYEKEGTGVTSMNQNHTTYAAMVESVDESVGKIKKTLQELSLNENTIIIFKSDNGGLSNTGYAQRELATSNYPLRAQRPSGIHLSGIPGTLVILPAVCSVTAIIN